ncbi:MAG: sigma factor-like helix-turn-helix DNA-binding protein [Chloroflexota bacterium]
MNSKINLKVLILDQDFYALESLNSYLAWDRRTRVIALTYTLDEAVAYLKGLAVAELPDVILLDSELFKTTAALSAGLAKLRSLVAHVMILCLGRSADGERAAAAFDAGARGYLLRNEVKIQIVGAIVYALEHKFIITPGIREAASTHFDVRIFNAAVVPSEREYPGLTDRVRQALWLCVIEGLPAHLAADEMGVSPHTVRSYIKEGYRILESYDDTAYPEDMGPLERAFMRFTALEDPDDAAQKAASEPPDQQNHSDHPDQKDPRPEE